MCKTNLHATNCKIFFQQCIYYFSNNSFLQQIVKFFWHNSHNSIKRKKILFVLFFFLFISISKSEISLYHQIEEFQAIKEIKIKHFWIIEKSEKIYLDKILLEKNYDYTINYETGIITILCPTPPKKIIHLEYDILPINLKKSYGAQFQENFFLPPESKKSDIKIKGYKKMGINLISDQDISFQQSLKLNINGNLDFNTTINAYLCDENTPIQTEGITKEIKELDTIFIDIKSPLWSLNFGNYIIECPKFEFISLNKRLEGLKINGKMQKRNLTALASISKGKFVKINIIAKSGISKYELKVNEKFIIILAGTEKVWLKGILMKKRLDYVIDYNKGEIEFIGQKPILGEEEIIVSFEYLKENYIEKIFGFTSYNLLYSPNFSLNFNIFNYENENIELTNQTKKDYFFNQENGKLLQSPQNYLVSAINTEWKIFSFLNIGSEYAFSYKNKKTISDYTEKIEKGNALNLKLFTKQNKFFLKSNYYYLSENFISVENTLNSDFLNRWKIFNFNKNLSLKCLEAKTSYEISEFSLFDIACGEMIENYKTKNISTHRLNFNYNFCDNVKYEFRNIFSFFKRDKYQMLKLKKNFSPFTYSLKFETEQIKDNLLNKKNYIGETFLQGNWEKINCNYFYQIKFDKNKEKIDSFLNKFDISFNKIKNFYFIGSTSMIDFYENEKKQKDFLIYIDTRYSFFENLLTTSNNYKTIQKLTTKSIVPYFTSQEMEQLKLTDKYEIKSAKIKEKILNFNIEINENKKEEKFQIFTKFPFKIILNFNDENMQNKLVKKKYKKRFIQNLFPQNKFISVVGEVLNEDMFDSFYYPNIFQKTLNYKIDFNMAPFRKISYLLEIEKSIIKKDFKGDFFYWKDFEKEQNNLVKAVSYFDIKTDIKLSFSYSLEKKDLLYNYQKNKIITNEFSFSLTKYMGHYGVLNTQIGSKKKS
ncbi:MAG: hypothetical protein ABIB46_06670, partial [bacterium]